MSGAATNCETYIMVEQLSQNKADTLLYRPGLGKSSVCSKTESPHVHKCPGLRAFPKAGPGIPRSLEFTRVRLHAVPILFMSTILSLLLT